MCEDLQLWPASPHYESLLDKTSWNLSRERDEEANSQHVYTSFVIIVGFYMTGVLCILGFVGNMLCLVVIKRRQICAMFILLSGLLVCDAVFISLTFIFQVLINLYPVVGYGEALYRYSGYIIKYGTPFVSTVQSSIIYITVCLSLERYAVVCKPLLAIKLCKVRKAKMAILVIVFLSFLVNIPKFWERTVMASDNSSYLTSERSAISEHPVYRIFYSAALHFVTLFVLPVAILGVLCSKLIRTLRRTRQTWERQETIINLSERRYGENNFILRKKNEHTITYVSLAIVLVFILCGCPDLGIKFIIYICNIKERPWLISLIAASNFLVLINSASNLVIYCLMGSRFRSDLKGLLCPCLKRMCSKHRQHLRPETEGTMGRLLPRGSRGGTTRTTRLSLGDTSLNYVTQTACTTTIL